MPRRASRDDTIYNALLAAESAIDAAKRSYLRGDLSVARERCDRAATAAGDAQSDIQNVINDARRLEAESETSLRPRPGESAEATVERVTQAVRREPRYMGDGNAV